MVVVCMGYIKIPGEGMERAEPMVQTTGLLLERREMGGERRMVRKGVDSVTYACLVWGGIAALGG